jgi:hypothetical protein
MLLFFSAPFSVPVTVVKPSKMSRHPEAPAHAAEPAAHVAPRCETADQRQRILERLTGAVSTLTHRAGGRWEIFRLATP